MLNRYVERYNDQYACNCTKTNKADIIVQKQTFKVRSIK